MSRESFVPKKFAAKSLAMIEQANTIIAEYKADGYTLTLRQLYYQFVSRDWLGNTQKNYKRLGSIINDARLAGLIDWDAIEDRTRGLKKLGTWDSGKDILEAVSEQFRYDLWADQTARCEVWVEKDALTGVVERACADRRVPYFACRGYTSQSEQYRASKRFQGYHEAEQHVTIFHLGDHDPSGIDMTRDNQDRLDMFLNTLSGDGVRIERLALNMDQVRRHRPPPNPAKMTDSRVGGYIKKFGKQSWELDALNPRMLTTLIQENVDSLIDNDLWDEAVAREAKARKALGVLATKWKDPE